MASRTWGPQPPSLRPRPRQRVYLLNVVAALAALSCPLLFTAVRPARWSCRAPLKSSWPASPLGTAGTPAEEARQTRLLRRSVSASPTEVAPSPTTSSHADPPVLTYLGVNSFALEIGGRRLLVDPLLTGDLVFLEQEWAFSGSRRAASVRAGMEPQKVPELFDAIVLSQGLEDHAHPPTLKGIPRDMLVIGSKSAAAVARGFGFTNVWPLEHGESFDGFGPDLRITALPGSVVGPPWTDPENAYVFEDLRAGGMTFGTEPHGNFLGPALGTSFLRMPAAPKMRVDALLMPLTSQSIAGYQLVNGPNEAVATLEALTPAPKFVLPLKNAELDASGFLADNLKEEGSPAEFAELLRRHPRLKDVHVLDVVPGEPLRIE